MCGIPNLRLTLLFSHFLIPLIFCYCPIKEDTWPALSVYTAICPSSLPDNSFPPLQQCFSAEESCELVKISFWFSRSEVETKFCISNKLSVAEATGPRPHFKKQGPTVLPLYAAIRRYFKHISFSLISPSVLLESYVWWSPPLLHLKEKVDNIRWELEQLIHYYLFDNEKPVTSCGSFKTCYRLFFISSIQKGKSNSPPPGTQTSLRDMLLKNCRGNEAEWLPRLGHKRNTASTCLSLNHVPLELPWSCLPREAR